MNNEGERIKFTQSPRAKIIYFIYCLSITLVPLAISLWFLVQGVIHLGLLLQSIIAFTIVFLTYYIEKLVSNTLYGLTDKYIYVKSGILQANERRLPYKYVTIMRIKQNSLQRILRLGTLELYSFSMDKPALTLSNIDYNDIHKILEIIEKKII